MVIGKALCAIAVSCGGTGVNKTMVIRKAGKEKI